MCFVSIIIPVYNVEKYLEECMSSIFSQTINNFEVILVDDGSNDSSSEMCDRYAKNDTRVKVIHKSNGGLSSARNSGLKCAVGDYILYVDSDDYLSDNYLEEMYNIILKKEYDMVIGRTTSFVDGSKPVDKDDYIVKEFTPEETMECIYYQNYFDTNACAKMIKREIAINNLFEEGVLYEDFNVIHQIVFSCQSIIFLSKPQYYYRNRQDSIMNSNFDERKFFLLDVAEKHVDFVREQHPDLLSAVYRRYVYSNFHILGRVIFDYKYKKESESIRKNILRYGNDVLRNKKVGMKEKVSILILKCGLLPYRIAWRFFCIVKGKRI